MPLPAQKSPPPGYYPPPGYDALPGHVPPPNDYPPPDNARMPVPYPQALYDALPSTPTVAAGPPPSARKVPPPYSYGATLATSTVSEPNSTSVVLSPLLEGAYALDPHILFDLAWGFGWLLDNQGLGQSTVRAGNPQLFGYFHGEAGPWRFRAGVGVTAPLAHLPLNPDGRTNAFLYNQTMAMWGMWNLWLWSPDRMAVPSMFRVSYIFPGGQTLAFEEASAVVFGARANASGTESLEQVALEAQIPIGSVFVLTPRFQTVLLPSTSVDRFQSAAGLRGTLQTKAGRFFAELLLNLDEPLGVFAGLGRWGFHLGKEMDL